MSVNPDDALAGGVPLLELPQPVCIVTKSDALSVATAALLLATFYAEDKRCLVHPVQQYTTAELDALLCEEYSSFLFLDCTEPDYKARFASRRSVFVSSEQAYSSVRSFSSVSRDCSYLLVAGGLGRYLENGGPFVVLDIALQDALQSGCIISDAHSDYTEIDDRFLAHLTVLSTGTRWKLLDFADMLNACVRGGKISLLISTIFGHSAAKDAVFQLLVDYRRDVEAAFDWYERNKTTSRVVLGRGTVFVYLQDYVTPHIAGSLAARLALRAQFDDRTFVVVLVYVPDARVRVSLRMVGYHEDINLLSVLPSLFEGLHGEYGGTASAAGGSFVRADEERFISNAQKILGQLFVEESVKS